MEFATRLPTIPRLHIEPTLSSILNQKLPPLPTPSSHNLSDYSYSHRRSSASTQGGRSEGATLFADSRLRNRTQDPRTPPPDMANPTGLLQRWNALGQIETVCPREGLQGDGTWVPSISPGYSQQPQHNTGNPSSISVYTESNEELPPQPKRRSSSARNNGAMMVPEEIISSKKVMAEFAAEITCLFWFESAGLLQTIAESIDISLLYQQKMSKYAIPHPEFLAWVATVLNTTQVSLNVVLLALLFVHRLKKLNPAVQGRPGSQYRLFTVALMLGNKYLDDNTYTNKTWADVSGISVQEIHIMEVEFLSNMRYSLYVPESEWSSWPERLRRFHAYWDHARKLPLSNTPPQNANRTLPLQTAASRTLPPSPPYTCDLQIPMPLPPVEINPQMITTTNDLENSRKRSLDQSAMQPPPPHKRMARLPLSVAVPQYQNNYQTCFTKPASDQPFYNIIPGGPGGPGYYGSASQQQQQQTAYHPTPFPHSLATPQQQQQQRPENYLPAPIPNPLSNLLPPPTGMVQQPYQCLPPIVRFETALQTQQMIMERGIQQQQPQVLPQQQAAPQEQQQQQQHQLPQLPLPHNRALSCASSFTSPISNSPGSGVAFNNSPFNIHQPRSPYSAHHSLVNSPLTPGGAGSFNNGGLSTVPSFGGFTGGLPTPVTMGREMAGRDYHTRASSAALGFLDGLSQMSQAQISQMKQSAKEFRDRDLQLEEESETRLKRDREIWQVGREREEREKEQAQIREIWQAGRTREEREKVQEQIRKQNTALLNQYSRTTSIDMQDFLDKMEPQHQQPQQSRHQQQRHQQQQFGLTRLPNFPEIPSASSNSTLNSSFHLDNPGTLGTPGTTGTQSNPVNLDSSNSLPELPPCPPSFQTRLYHLPTPGEPAVSTYGLPTPAPATATSNYVPATSTYNLPATLATSSENSRSRSPVRILTMQIDAGLAGLARKNHQLPPVNHVEGYGKDAFALRHG